MSAEKSKVKIVKYLPVFKSAGTDIENILYEKNGQVFFVIVSHDGKRAYLDAHRTNLIINPKEDEFDGKRLIKEVDTPSCHKKDLEDVVQLSNDGSIMTCYGRTWAVTDEDPELEDIIGDITTEDDNYKDINSVKKIEEVLPLLNFKSSYDAIRRNKFEIPTAELPSSIIMKEKEEEEEEEIEKISDKEFLNKITTEITTMIEKINKVYNDSLEKLTNEFEDKMKQKKERILKIERIDKLISTKKDVSTLKKLKMARTQCEEYLNKYTDEISDLKNNLEALQDMAESVYRLSTDEEEEEE